jgi:hypothetical protein
MARSVGVTLVAGVVFIGSAFAILCGAMMALAARQRPVLAHRDLLG